VDVLREGEVVLVPERSGGPFDPLGPRGQDVKGADDLVKVLERRAVRCPERRWVMVTLTMDRNLFDCPGLAYDEGQQRVKRVGNAVAVDGFWVAAFEVQTKTGDGWPHWHLLVEVAADVTVEDLRRRVVRAWVRRREVIDEVTGEVAVHLETLADPRAVDVRFARTIEGVARYVAKYIVKQWEAVSGWMGDSSRQLRKLRKSEEFFRFAEAEGLLVRSRGSRRRPVKHRRRARTLFERMASSGGSYRVFARDEAGLLKFKRVVKLPATMETVLEFTRGGGRLVDPLVPWERMKVVLASSAVPAVVAASQAPEWVERRELESVRREHRVRSAWAEMQDRRRRVHVPDVDWGEFSG
jgi:hypothetical protein